MEEHAFTHWIYAMAALLLSVSLYAGDAGNYHALRKVIVKTIPYFFSFGPVALLIYSLYMISQIH